MSTAHRPALAFESAPSRRLRDRVWWLGSMTLFAVMPSTVLVAVLADILAEREVPVEPEAYYRAAERVLAGESPYVHVDDAGLIAGDGYVYPPLIAIATTPFTLVPALAAGLMMAVLVAASVVAVPYVLGVRDWRCYGIAMLWPPVVLGIQTGNVNMLLALVIALVWALRSRPAASGLTLGAAFAAKLLLWPLAVWQLAIRRISAAAWAAASALVLSLVAWAIVAFDGLRSYPALLERLSSLMDDRGYSVYALAFDLGAPELVAKALWAAVALGLVAGIALAARRAGARSAFVVAVAASLAVTPVVWLHYFVFLLPVIALVQPRLGLLWFAPLAMFLTDGGMNPGPSDTAATLAVAAVVFALALRESVRVPGDRSTDASVGTAAARRAAT